jgi:hypothetical protein
MDPHPPSNYCLPHSGKKKWLKFNHHDLTGSSHCNLQPHFLRSIIHFLIYIYIYIYIYMLSLGFCRKQQHKWRQRLCWWGQRKIAKSERVAVETDAAFIAESEEADFADARLINRNSF